MTSSVVVFSADSKRITVTATPGDAYTPVILEQSQCVVTAIPGSSGTLQVLASWSDQAAVAANTANWFAWDAGTVSSPTNQLLQNATAVRFIATGSAGVGEIAR